MIAIIKHFVTVQIGSSPTIYACDGRRGLVAGAREGCVEVRSEGPAAGIYLQRMPSAIGSGGGGGWGGIP